MSIRERLAEENPDAILYDDCDSALVGIGHRCSENGIAIYSYRKLLEHFISEFGDYESAAEWIDFNILGGWVGKYTPLIMMDGDE